MAPDLTLAELFSGIGGWSEAAKMAGGIRPVWCSEIDAFKNKIYEKHHSGVPNLGDIRSIQQTPYADIFTVSFPCTDISAAGKGAGLEGADSSLWFEALRLIGQSRPRYVVIESGLAAFGYDAEWQVIQGTAFEIQQRRARLYLIAYANGDGQQGQYPKSGVFRSVEPPKPDAQLVYPGWRTRGEIPQPRTYHRANDIPGGVSLLRCTGDAIMPLVGMYVLECVKRHYTETTTFATH